MPKKQKRVNLTKEQIHQQIKATTKAKEGRIFVKEKFYPALCEATTTISDADVFLGSFSNMIMESFLGFMKEKKFSELNLVTKLDPKSSQYEPLKKMIELFDAMPISDARDLIDGMKDEIKYFYKKDMQERKLTDLKINLLD